MKKAITLITLIASAVLILDSFNVVHAATYFVIAGQIPGTSIILDGETMLLLCTVPMGIIAGRLTARCITLLAQPRRVQQNA